jgi:hypothetical protein
MATSACPYCYETINRARLAYQCTGRGVPGRTGCGRTVDPVRAQLTGYGAPMLPVFPPPAGRFAAVTGGPRRAPCPQCGGPTGVRACPICHTPLPAAFAEADVPLVGVVGGKGAGKTVYLAVLNHELRHAVRRRFDADIRFSGDQQPVGSGFGSPRAWLENYEKALFEDGELPAGTTAADTGRRVPLVLEWRQPRSRAGRTRYATTLLSFYDAAGEDFVSESSKQQKYVEIADGLVVLLDPWQLPDLPPEVTVPAAAVSGAEKPIDVLNRVTELLRAGSGGSTDKKLRTPIAVVFAKIDALYPALDPDDPVLARPPAAAGYDERAGATTHEHVRALLHRFGADDIDAHLRHTYRDFRYFAVSALGMPPDYTDARVDPGGVRPLRVEEPLLWLLSKWNVVERIEP